MGGCYHDADKEEKNPIGVPRRSRNGGKTVTVRGTTMPRIRFVVARVRSVEQKNPTIAPTVGAPAWVDGPLSPGPKPGIGGNAHIAKHF